jgi:hypothetical protein
MGIQASWAGFLLGRVFVQLSQSHFVSFEDFPFTHKNAREWMSVLDVTCLSWSGYRDLFSAIYNNSLILRLKNFFKKSIIFSGYIKRRGWGVTHLVDEKI